MHLLPFIPLLGSFQRALQECPASHLLCFFLYFYLNTSGRKCYQPFLHLRDGMCQFQPPVLSQVDNFSSHLTFSSPREGGGGQEKVSGRPSAAGSITDQGPSQHALGSASVCTKVTGPALRQSGPGPVWGGWGVLWAQTLWGTKQLSNEYKWYLIWYF